MGELFMTEHYYIRSLFAKHGLIPNEHFMNGLCLVCSMTGCSVENVISFNRDALVVYTRHLWFMYMKLLGFSPADIAAITGRRRSGVDKALSGIHDRIVLPYVQLDIYELQKSASILTGAIEKS